MSKPSARELCEAIRMRGDTDAAIIGTNLAARVERVLADHQLEPEWRRPDDFARGALRRCMCGAVWELGCRSRTVRLLNGEEP